MAVIEFDNVRFTYDGKRNALEDISLHIEQGSFTCILGGNGSGKSTLAKHVNALLVPDDGRACVLGADTSDPERVFFIRSNAGMVFQNPDDQIVASVIEDDVAFGPENLGVPTAELQERVASALKQVGLQGFEKKETAALSGGQKQRVAIAGVLAMQPQILVLDEASAMLDPRGRKGLARVCRELNEAGLTVLLITHFMEEAAHADRVIVLENGHVALDGKPAEILTQVERLQGLSLDIPFAARFSYALQQRGVNVPVTIDVDELVTLLQKIAPDRLSEPATSVGGAISEDCLSERSERVPQLLRQSEEREAQLAEKVHLATPRSRFAWTSSQAQIADQAYSQQEPAKPVLLFENVSFTYQPIKKGRRARNAVATDAVPADWGNDPSEYWALKGVSFQIRRGEFFGIAGHTGSGKSTLIQLANGLLQPTAGRVFANGHDLSDKRAAVEARRDVGVVFQYPEHQLFAATVFDDVAFGPRNLGLSADEIEQRVREAMQLVHLDLDDIRNKSPFALSGGQQRRVAFAGVLAMRPSTLILDEPAAGLDPQGKQKFMNLIAELHEQQGMTVVIVSHDMNDLANLCDYMLVLNRGELFALGTPAEVFADEARMKGVGLGVPDTLHLAGQIGIDADFGDAVPTVDELADLIADLTGNAESAV